MQLSRGEKAFRDDMFDTIVRHLESLHTNQWITTYSFDILVQALLFDRTDPEGAARGRDVRAIAAPTVDPSRLGGGGQGHSISVMGRKLTVGNSGPLYTAIEDFVAQQPGDLEFQRGDTIEYIGDAADDPHELSAREAQQQQHNNNASFRALDYKKQVQNLIEAGKRLLCSSGHYHQHTGTLADAEQSALPPVAESTAAAAADQAFAPPEAHPIACYFPPRVDADDDNVWPRFSPPSAAAPQKKRSRAPYDHTPRPSNSFMIYRREKQAEILAQYRGQKALHNNTISKVVADMWRGETPEVRQQYAAKADEEVNISLWQAVYILLLAYELTILRVG
ncbi:hypothetical protein HDU84_006123 [Entophlyctis sp. JEL0112]|nr:hypothetical protein HDU84_006123 [Entophlyctis sp. JEL0112]